MSPPVSQLRAMALALAAYTCWVLADTNLKIAGTSAMPAYEVIALVGATEVLLLSAYSILRGRWRDLWPRDPKRQLLRSSLDLINNIFVVVALRHLPLALFYILVFFAPMVTAILGAVFLQERLDWKASLAVVVGFLGVVLAIDPLNLRASGDWRGYAACMVCVVAFSINTVWSRVLTQRERSESLTFTSGLVMALGGSVGLVRHPAPFSLHIAGVLAATGVFSIIGSLCFFMALRQARAASVTQYHYSQLLTGALLAYVLWRERITWWMLSGAVLIIGSGIYTAYRNTDPHAAVTQPPDVAALVD